MKLMSKRKQMADGFNRLGLIFTSLFVRTMLCIAVNTKRLCLDIVSIMKPYVLFMGKKLYYLINIVLMKIKKHILRRKEQLISHFAFIKRSYAKGGIKAAFRFFVFGSKKHGFKRSLLSTILNYTAPVVCVVLLFNIVSFATNAQYVVGVSLDGEVVGYIENEAVYNDAKAVLQDRIDYSDTNVNIEFEPVFSVVRNSGKQLVNKNELADMLLTHTNIDFQEAYGIYAGNEFLCAVADGEAVEKYVNDTVESYRVASGAENAENITSISCVDGLYTPGSIKSFDEVKTMLHTSRDVEVKYTVKQGDTIDSLAFNYGMSKEDFQAKNADIADKLIKDTVVTLNVSEPYINVLVTKNVTENESLPFNIITTKDNSMSISDYPVTTVKGENGTKEVLYNVVYKNGKVFAKTKLSETVTKQSVDEQIRVGTLDSSNGEETAAFSDGTGSNQMAIDGGFIWPVGGNGGYVSEVLYGYSGHTGIDIATDAGTQVFAAADGVVTYAATRGSYGKLIIVAHSNGYVTYYAHCRYIGVTAGQTVSQGDFIGEVGMTGNATGNHLHFEVRTTNGDVLNPIDYVER